MKVETLYLRSSLELSTQNFDGHIPIFTHRHTQKLGHLKIRIVLKQIQKYTQMNDAPILANIHTINIMLKLRSSEKEKLKLKENGVSVNCEC